MFPNNPVKAEEVALAMATIYGIGNPTDTSLLVEDSLTLTWDTAEEVLYNFANGKLGQGLDNGPLSDQINTLENDIANNPVYQSLGGAELSAAVGGSFMEVVYSEGPLSGTFSAP
jgi:hypothetical protein